MDALVWEVGLRLGNGEYEPCYLFFEIFYFGKV